MSSPTRTRSTMMTILLGVQAQIIASASYFAVSLDASRCLITALPAANVPHTQGDQDVLVRLMNENPNEGFIEGGGRVVDYRYRTLEITVRSRTYLDDVQQDLVRLTDSTLGHIVLEDAVVNALQCIQIGDSSQNLLTEPMTVGSISTPEKDRDDPNWVSSSLSVKVPYSRNLDQNVQ